MHTWVALLRGINVGGHNRLPMRGLADIFAAAGSTNVKTYIQSGNVVFSADIRSTKRFGDAIGDAIAAEFGFHPAIHFLTAQALYGAIADNPYPEAAARSLHLFFLEAAPAKMQLQELARLAIASESFTVIASHLYLHAPEGIGRSRLAKGVDRALAMSATARNWRTATRLAEMAAAIDAGRS